MSALQSHRGARGARRVFVAGATGVIGIRLVPLLLAAGHDVAAMTRSAGKQDALRALGAEPVLCDVYDAAALRAAVAAFAPDVVIHQLTDLPDHAVDLLGSRAANARMRREGTRNLVAAAQNAGAARLLAQSVAWPLEGDGAASLAEHEAMVLDADGVVLRYGQLYGPGTYYQDELPSPPRVHVDAAARGTLPALGAASGVVVIAEDA
jgi:nucleoside-diphosphate-sugar epimerase